MLHRAVVSLCAVGCLIGSGCAKRSENVAAAYVSPLQYERYTCAQIGEEGQRISVRVAELSGVQDRKRTGDIVATTAAIIVFWPAAFLVGGDDAQTAELARMKGEIDALQQASIRKNCGLQFQIQQAPPPPREPYRPYTGSTS